MKLTITELKKIINESVQEALKENTSCGIKKKRKTLEESFYFSDIDDSHSPKTGSYYASIDAKHSPETGFYVYNSNNADFNKKLFDILWEETSPDYKVILSSASNDNKIIAIAILPEGDWNALFENGAPNIRDLSKEVNDGGYFVAEVYTSPVSGKGIVKIKGKENHFTDGDAERAADIIINKFYR